MSPTNTPNESPSIYVQITPISSPKSDKSGTKRGARDKMVELTEAQMDQAFAVAETVAGRTARMLTTLQAKEEQNQLTGAELEFGISFSADMQAYVVSASTEATLHIKLTWDTDKE